MKNNNIYLKQILTKICFLFVIAGSKLASAISARKLTTKKKKIISLSLLMFLIGATLTLLLSPTMTTALGVAPSSFELEYEPGIQELYLRVLNSDNEELFLSLRAQGDLADYVIFDEEFILLSEEESERTVEYRLSVPPMLSPGDHVLRVFVTEEDIDNPGGASDIAAGLSVVQRVTVAVPYPGRYIESELFIDVEAVNKPIIFTTYATNKGVDDVVVSGKVTITTPSDKIVSSVSIPKQTVEAISKKKLVATMDGLVNPGLYYAESTLYYDDKSITQKEPFMLGDIFLDLVSIEAEDFSLGGIARMNLMILNKWNTPVEDAYLEVELFSETGKRESFFKTPLFTAEPNISKTVTSYWETDGMHRGLYDAKVTFYYEGKTDTIYYTAAAQANRITFTSVDGLTGNVVASTGGRGSIWTFAFVLLAIGFIIMNVFWFRTIKKIMLSGKKGTSDQTPKHPGHRDKWQKKPENINQERSIWSEESDNVVYEETKTPINNENQQLERGEGKQ